MINQLQPLHSRNSLAQIGKSGPVYFGLQNQQNFGIGRIFPEFNDSRYEQSNEQIKEKVEKQLIQRKKLLQLWQLWRKTSLISKLCLILAGICIFYHFVGVKFNYSQQYIQQYIGICLILLLLLTFFSLLYFYIVAQKRINQEVSRINQKFENEGLNIKIVKVSPAISNLQKYKKGGLLPTYFEVTRSINN